MESQNQVFQFRFWLCGTRLDVLVILHNGSLSKARDSLAKTKKFRKGLVIEIHNSLLFYTALPYCEKLKGIVLSITMYLNDKTLEKLRLLINEETQYRSGPQLVDFFNALGFSETYQWGGAPSRWRYTDDRLKVINGKPELDQCIKNLFNPINFISRMAELDNFIIEFNKYLAFDGWNVVRSGKEITFKRTDTIDALNEIKKENITENEFINKEFLEISIEKLGIADSLLNVLNNRIEEIKMCLQVKSALAVIFLCGSTLEGLLLDTALKYPNKYNQTKSAPKDKESKVKPFHEWSLNNFIDTSYELGYIKEDVKKFSHVLRDFRNYIHPYQQMSSQFNPDEHTAKICFQVLKAAIYQLGNINNK
jgi:hypothetical protein